MILERGCEYGETRLGDERRGIQRLWMRNEWRLELHKNVVSSEVADFICHLVHKKSKTSVTDFNLSPMFY